LVENPCPSGTAVTATLNVSAWPATELDGLDVIAVVVGSALIVIVWLVDVDLEKFASPE
jgi:hypothetical protein